MALRVGLGRSFFILGAAFFIAALLALALPETKGKQLELHSTDIEPANRLHEC